MIAVTDEDIRDKYLDRAILELNEFTRAVQTCKLCKRKDAMPIIGSGHPQADIFLLKHSPQETEIEEGVAFYGRSGTALRKAFHRLSINPLNVYGTLCIKCPVDDARQAAKKCVAKLEEEVAIVAPRIVVVMGEEALAVLNRLSLPLSKRLKPSLGKIQLLTPSIEALYIPDIDEAFTSDSSKQAFWHALRILGDWVS